MMKMVVVVVAAAGGGGGAGVTSPKLEAALPKGVNALDCRLGWFQRLLSHRWPGVGRTGSSMLDCKSASQGAWGQPTLCKVDDSEIMGYVLTGRPETHVNLRSTDIVCFCVPEGEAIARIP